MHIRYPQLHQRGNVNFINLNLFGLLRSLVVMIQQLLLAVIGLLLRVINIILGIFGIGPVSFFGFGGL